MALSKAQRSQRNRRQKESEKYLCQLARPPKKLKKSSSNAPILIPSDSDDDEVSTQIHKIDPSDSDIEIMDFHELEMDERNSVNDMIQFIQASLDDDTSDEDEDSDSDSDGEDRPSEALWSIFTMANSEKAAPPSGRKLHSGKTGYRKPIENPSSSSQKLIPAAIPKQTKHYHTHKRIQALGKNNSMMDNYLIKENKANTPVIDSSNQDLAFLSHSTDDNSQIQTNNHSSITSRLSHYSKLYLAAPKSKEITSKIKEKALSKWEKLNHAINFVTAENAKKLKKNPNFKFNSTVIANLNEFNQLRHDFTIKGIKSPSNAAALATAQSSIRRLTSERGPQQERSGIHMAKKIAKQARYIVDNKAILELKACNRVRHPSHLDNLDLRRALFKCASFQTPGEVCRLFKSFWACYLF
jgi:hypothetical protein